MSVFPQAPLFQHGIALAERQFYHAALEVWDTLAEQIPGEVALEDRARLYDEMGKVYIQLANVEQGLEFFSKAVELSTQPDASLVYTMHVALTYVRAAQYDRAQRVYTQLATQAEGFPLSPFLRGYLFSNLAYLQARGGFFQEAVAHTLTGLDYFQKVGAHHYTPVLYTNLGFLLIELEQYAQAEDYLLKACDLYEDPLPAITELCRLYLMRNQYAQSILYAEQALDLIWSSFINYEKEEIARLCHLFGRLAYQYGERQIAVRLVEKAQLLFGQLGLWHEWSRVQSVLDDWQTTPVQHDFELGTQRMQQLIQFVLLLDAMNAQEIIHDRFSTLLDTRVLYARALVAALGYPKDDEQLLVYASRFADYGLTALEPEVALNPERSAQAFIHYRQHPILSVRMLAEIDVPVRVQRIILDHHEHFDGSGYPHGKKGPEIDPLACVLAIADAYATGIVLEERIHSDVITSLAERQQQFNPEMLETFLGLFMEM